MTALMLCAAALAVSGCGQKRPLQLPTKHPAPATAQPAASAASAPY
ncbi:LPS translocon maturation chaperone LptM [Roseateles sp. MS654]